MKQVPNLFTLLNLFFGCIAIVFIMQNNSGIIAMDETTGNSIVVFPERMAFGALFIFFAAAVDFFDGFFARMLKASTDKGKQLDSLSDVVSFGVAPGMILYQLLRLGYAEGTSGLETSFALLLPAFIFTCAVAWRLAKFNVSTNQSDSFIGVPSPAAGLVVASFPLIIWYEYFGLQHLFINQWLLYAVIFLLSFLMVCNRTFLAIKFKDFSFKNNLLKYILIILSVILIVWVQWFAIPVIFVLYLVFSAFSKVPPPVIDRDNEKTLDITA
ncbi:MAG: CDP-alcohol phosphatidyltransferase [Chitinophagaceae bacterium]|nr:MAG: CDP-alcohol phosphatidyltransferase [Chitinophagaceae bacterium]